MGFVQAKGDRSGFVRRVTESISHHGVEPARVTLELTEAALIANPGQAKRVIRQLREHGVGLSVDDFGAGFTAFSCLREFAVSEIKVDRTYIAHVSDDRFDQALVTSLVALSDGLGISLVAEGVEDLPTREMLVSLGCYIGQGHGLCQPMPCDDIPGWIEDWAEDWARESMRSAA